MRKSLLMLFLLLCAQVMAAPYGVASYGVGSYNIGPPDSPGGGGGGKRVECEDCEPVPVAEPAPEPIPVPVEVTEQAAAQTERPARISPPRHSGRTPTSAKPSPVQTPSLLTGLAIQASAITYPLRHPEPRENPGFFYSVLLILACILLWMEHKRAYPILPYVFITMPFTRRLGEWLLKPPKNYLKHPTVR